MNDEVSFPPPPGEPWPLPSRVIMVCIGNICRSPMAEALLLLAMRERGLATRVSSAGTGACVGMPADPLSLRLMAERGLDIGAHRGRQLLPQDMEGDVQLLVMAGDQAQWIGRKRPAARRRVALLGAWTGGDIADPVGGSRGDFEEALVQIEAGVDAWLERGWQTPVRASPGG